MRETGASPSIAKVIRTAQGGRCLKARLVVFAVAMTMAVQIGFSLINSLDFEYDHSSGIVGWAAVNDYPIQQETTFWMMSVLLVTASFLVSWALWLAAGWLLTRLGRTEPARALTQATASLSWFFVLWLGFSDLDSLVFHSLAPPATLAVLTIAGFLTIARWRPGAALSSGSEVDPPPTHPTQLTEDKTVSIPPPARRGWNVARRVLVWLVVPMAIYMTHRSPVAQNHVDLFHEGEFLYPMREVLDGAVPFRDVYLQHGLLHNAWFPVLGSLLTGETEAAGRVARHLLLPLGAVTTYLLGMTLFRGSVLRALLLVFFFSTCVTERYIFTYVALALALAAMGGPAHYSLLRSPPAEPDPWDHRRRLRTKTMLFASGFAAAMAFWHTLDSGVFSIASIVLFLFIVGFLQPEIRTNRRPVPLLVFTGGVAAGFCLFGVYFLYHGALDDLLRNIYIQSAFHLDIWGKAFPSLEGLLTPLSEEGWIKGGLAVARDANLKFFWPPVTLLLAVAVLTHRWLARSYWSSRTCVAATLITLAGLALFRGALGRSDPAHLASGAMLAPVLALVVLDRWATRAWERLRVLPRRSGASVRALAQLTTVVLLVVGFGTILSHDFNTTGRIKRGFRSMCTQAVVRDDGGTILPKRGPVTLRTPKAKQTPGIAQLVDFIRAQTEPDDYVFDFSNQAVLLFLADRRSPTRYFMAVYASPPDLQLEVIASLEEKQPPLVIFRGGYFSDHLDGVRTDKRLPLVAEYLRENYRVAERIGKATFLERK